MTYLSRRGFFGALVVGGAASVAARPEGDGLWSMTTTLQPDGTRKLTSTTFTTRDRRVFEETMTRSWTRSRYRYWDGAETP